MSLENPKTILSWFKLNVSNSEMVESIDRIIDTLNQMPMMKKKSEELKGKISSDTERVTNAVARVNSDTTQENIAELLQIINTVCEAADIESDAQILKEYNKRIHDVNDIIFSYGVDTTYTRAMVDVEVSITNALLVHSEFADEYKNNLPKLTNHLEQLVSILNKERDIRAKLDEVMGNTEDYSIVRTSKVIEHCIQEMKGIERMFDDMKGKIRSDIGLEHAQNILRIPLNKILNNISKKVSLFGPSIDLATDWNKNFKLIKNECIKLNIDLMSLYPELKKDLERQSSSDLLQLRDLVGRESASTVEHLRSMQSALSELRLVLSERSVMGPHRVFIAEIIKKLELQLETFNEIKLKFQDVLKFTSAGQIEQNRDDFIAKIRALKRDVKSIDKRVLLKEAIKNDSSDIVKSLIKKGTVLDAEMKAFTKEHGSAEMLTLIELKSLIQKLSLIVKQALDALDGCSSAKRRKKRQPCNSSTLEKEWNETKDSLQEQVESISKLQAKLTEGESFVKSVSDNISSFTENLRRGYVTDLEIAINRFKILSASADDSFIRHKVLQEEAVRDIVDAKINISHMKGRFTDTEVYHANQDDFDSIFNRIEQGLAGLNQKTEDYHTGIDGLGSAISNFESSISEAENALPIFREVKIISIRIDSRLEALPHNSNNRALLSLDHQRDIAKLQRLRERIQGIQDVPQGIKSFLGNEVEEVNKKAIQLSSCLQSGGRRKRSPDCNSLSKPETFMKKFIRISDKLGRYELERNALKEKIRSTRNELREQENSVEDSIFKQNSSLDALLREIELYYDSNPNRVKTLKSRILDAKDENILLVIEKVQNDITSLKNKVQSLEQKLIVLSSMPIIGLASGYEGVKGDIDICNRQYTRIVANFSKLREILMEAAVSHVVFEGDTREVLDVYRIVLMSGDIELIDSTKKGTWYVL